MMKIMMKGERKEAALFPLNMFLLPGSYTRLFIFEDRYKQLIADCEEGMPGFGIAYGGKENKANLASWVSLDSVENRYPGGEMDVVVHCTALCRVESINAQMGGKKYPGGFVEIFDEDLLPFADSNLKSAFRSFIIEQNRDTDGLLLSDDIDLYTIANSLGVSEADKLELAQLPNAKAQNQYLINYLRYLKLLEKQEKSVYKDIYLN